MIELFRVNFPLSFVSRREEREGIFGSIHAGSGVDARADSEPDIIFGEHALICAQELEELHKSRPRRLPQDEEPEMRECANLSPACGTLKIRGRANF